MKNTANVKSVTTTPEVNAVEAANQKLKAAMAAMEEQRRIAREAQEKLAAIEKENAEAFVAAKSNLLNSAKTAIAEYKSIASEAEYKTFLKTLFGARRKGTACSECGAKRHGSKSTCSKK